MASDGWQVCDSRAIREYRFDRAAGVLTLRFDKGRRAYDYPCDDGLFSRFEGATSKGRFVNDVLKPYAAARGWSRAPYSW